MFRKILAFKLRILSIAILRKYNPKVVAITGSVGKTSTKEAVYHVLKHKFKARKTQSNYNTEIGVPLTIIGSDSPGRSLIKWFGVFGKALKLIFKQQRYPEILILEMGADRPGDLKYLTSFIKPDVSIITNIGISHLEFFKTEKAIFNEKAQLVNVLQRGGVAILNYDDQKVRSLEGKTKARVLTYGLSSEADLSAEEFGLLKNLPKPLVHTFLAAIATASIFDIPTSKSEQILKNFKGTKGRLQTIKGVNGSTIIDDTYNSAPDSATSALGYLVNFEGKRKIAVMGRMAELGEETESGHRRVGKKAADVGLSLLFVKDNEAKLIGEEAVACGMNPEKVVEFSNSSEAVSKIRKEIGEDDVVLIKASQSDYFEDIVKGVMAEPERAEDLLVQRDYTRN